MISTIALAIIGLAQPAHAQDGCFNRLAQDLNCNAIEAADEVAVDLDDPLCVDDDHRDEFGNPYPNADYYVEYFAFGCQYLTAAFDEDYDGLSYGGVTIYDTDGLPSSVFQLARRF